MQLQMLESSFITYKKKQKTQKTALWSLKNDTNQLPLEMLMIKHSISII